MLSYKYVTSPFTPRFWRVVCDDTVAEWRRASVCLGRCQTFDAIQLRVLGSLTRCGGSPCSGVMTRLPSSSAATLDSASFSIAAPSAPNKRASRSAASRRCCVGDVLACYKHEMGNWTVACKVKIPFKTSKFGILIHQVAKRSPLNPLLHTPHYSEVFENRSY